MKDINDFDCKQRLLRWVRPAMPPTLKGLPELAVAEMQSDTVPLPQEEKFEITYDGNTFTVSCGKFTGSDLQWHCDKVPAYKYHCAGHCAATAKVKKAKPANLR